jgi:hypothetical protein
VKLIPRAALALLALALAACGTPSAPGGGTAAIVAPDLVVISGHVSAPGTKGPLLVFAVAGNAPEVADRETLGVAAIDAQGDFALTIAPAEAVAFAFLADGANDGAIDGGDPVALLTGPSFTALGGGEVVTLSDVALDFTARKASAAAVDVQRPGAATAEFTPTAVPAS